MIHQFFIPGTLPSGNAWIVSPKYRFTLNRKRQEWLRMIGNCIVAASLKPIPRPVTIHFNWIERNQLRDLDNIRSGAKLILDALQRCEVLKNDSQKWVTGLTDSYSCDPREPRVEVVLTEVGDEPA